MLMKRTLRKEDQITDNLSWCLHLDLLQERDPKITYKFRDLIVSDVEFVVSRQTHTQGYNLYLGTGSLHVLFHLSKFQFAALKLLDVSLWHIDKILPVNNLGKSQLKNSSFQVADARKVTHLLSQPAFACSFAILSKPSDCLLTPKE